MNAFAGEHGDWAHHASADWSPLLVVAVALVVIAIIAVLVGLFRHRPQNTVSPPATPLTPGQTPEVQSNKQSPSVAEEQQELEEAEGFYNYEDRVLTMLKEKGCPMPQAEIAQTMNLPEQDVAKSLAWLEQNQQVRRTWDAKRSTYMVEAMPDNRR